MPVVIGNLSPENLIAEMPRNYRGLRDKGSFLQHWWEQIGPLSPEETKLFADYFIFLLTTTRFSKENSTIHIFFNPLNSIVAFMYHLAYL